MLICQECHKCYEEKCLRWRCTCGGAFHLEGYTFRFEPSLDSGIWRYRQAIPLSGKTVISLGEGNTPLLERKIGGKLAYFKLDYLCPTGSYKDRGMSVLVSQLKALGISEVIEDSSGNAGSSMAAYCAAAGIACDVYVPEYTSSGKCVQIGAYGAKLVRVPGTREDTTTAAEEAGQKSYYASHNWNPWFLHGVKTWMLEVFESCPEVENLVLPVGQGSIALGAYLALDELKSAGLLKKYPRIFAVQAENCAPLAKAFEKGLKIAAQIEKKETAAEGIASAMPVRGQEVLGAVYSTRGCFITVSETEIWGAFELAAAEGLYVEPTSAAAVAGWLKLLSAGSISPTERTVVYLSGSGLKATDKIQSHFEGARAE